MKKQWMTIGIICACLVLLGGVMFLLKAPEGGAKAEKPAEKEEMLQELSEEELFSVAVENKSGGYKITWNDRETSVEGLEGLPLDGSKVQKVKKASVFLKSRKKIGGGEKRLEEFGLADPTAEVKITGKDGKESLFLIGDPAPDAEVESRYTLWENQVYVMDAGRVDIFADPAEVFLAKQVTPLYNKNEDDFLVTRVSLERKGEKPITIEYLKSEELAGCQLNTYRLTSPRVYPTDPGAAEQFLPSLFNIEAGRAVKVHPTEADRNACGLDNPYLKTTVQYKDSESKDQVFSLALSEPDASGNVYVMMQGIDVIYACSAAEIPWLQITEQFLISHTILAPDIRTLSAITVKETEGESYTLQLQNMGTEEAKVLYNGQKLDVDSFKNFYYTLISMSAEEVLFEKFPKKDVLTKKVVVTFEYTDKSAAKNRVTYYAEATRQLYAVIANKEQGFRLNAAQLEMMLDTLHRLVNGEKIKARY